MTVEDRSSAALLDSVSAIDGWLAVPAALLVIHLAGRQERLGIDGPMLEIGVHRGKFLALLRGLTKCKLVGVQLCEAPHVDGLTATIKGNIESAHGFADPIELLMSDSSTLSSAALMGALGARPRLIHIDGSHEAEYVHHDLSISGPILEEGGLLIMDDSYNSSTPGVIEGICRYFFANAEIAPFAQCYNKLFATTRSHHGRYLAATKDWLAAEAPAEVRDSTLRRVAENESAGYTPKLFGSEVAIFL